MPYLQPSPFIKNFDFNVKSLALSDILSNTISLSLVYTQMMFNLFQYAYRARYSSLPKLNMLFPSFTINNSVAISTEKYFQPWLAAVPRSSTASSSFPQSTIARNGIRFELENTHYTVFCEVENSYLSFRFIWYLLPWVPEVFFSSLETTEFSGKAAKACTTRSEAPRRWRARRPLISRVDICRRCITSTYRTKPVSSFINISLIKTS